MVKLSKQYVIEAVRHLLDEQELLTTSDQTVEDALPIDRRIENVYAGAYNHAQMLLPWHLTTRTPYTPTDSQHTADLQRGTGRITLPDDYLRLGELKMCGWFRSVHDTVSEGSGEHLLQHSYATRGGRVNPVAVLVDSGKAIEYYSLPRHYKAHEIDTMSVVRASAGLGNDEVQDGAERTIILTVARDTALSMGRDIRTLNERIKEELGIRN